MNEQSCCFVNLTLLIFCRPRCCRRPRCLSSPIKRAFQEPMSLPQARDYCYFYWNTAEERVLCLLVGHGADQGGWRRHTRTSCDSEPSCKGGNEALDKRIAIDGKKMIIQILTV